MYITPKAFTQIQIFLERWDRKEKLAAVYTFLDILVETLTNASDEKKNTFKNGDEFISKILSRRYLGYEPFLRDDVLIEANCERSSRMHDKNTLAHFQETANDFATRMSGERRGLCGGDVSVDSSIVWLNVANLIEELTLFAVDDNLDDLITIFTECYDISPL